MDEGMIDIEEYLIRKCEDEKEHWDGSDWNQKFKMAKKFGCVKQYSDSLAGKKDYDENH
jgi:hypothetical protein